MALLTDQGGPAPANPAQLARMTGWHRDELQIAENGRFWEPSIWHLDHLVKADPDSKELHARRARALAAVGDRDRASADFRLASDRPATLVCGLDDDITATGIDFGKLDAFTVEAWVFGWSGPVFRQMVPGSNDEHVWIYYGPETFAGWRIAGDKVQVNPTRPLVPGWTHLALVFDGKRQITFVDGKKASSSESPRAMTINPPGGWVIGPGEPDGRYTRGGFLGSLRVSNAARYREAFTPETSLASDGQTLTLYDFSRPTGETIPDQSGHDHAARMRGGVFVPLSGGR